MNGRLVEEFNGKIRELKKIAEELGRDFLEVNSSEESLIIEGVVASLEDAEQRIQRAVQLEEQGARQ